MALFQYIERLGMCAKAIGNPVIPSDAGSSQFWNTWLEASTVFLHTTILHNGHKDVR